MATTRHGQGAYGRLGHCVLLLALAMIAACSDAAPIAGPGPLPDLPDPPPVGSWVLKGVILEDLPVSPDVRLAPGVPVRVFGGGRVVEVISGGDASFEVDIPDTASFVRLVAAGPWYFTPCPAFRTGGAGRAEEPLEVHVVSGAVLSAATGLNGNFSAERLVWGQVSEQTTAGLRPISGATVTLLGRAPLENPLAVTLTGERGLYAICAPTRTSDYVVEVRKEGYAPAASAPVWGWDFETTDFVLTRR